LASVQNYEDEPELLNWQT